MSLVIVKGSELPLATSVSDVDELVGIQAGVSKRFRRGDIIPPGVGEGSPLVSISVDVVGDDELLLAAGAIILAVSLEGSGSASVGTTSGSDNIISDSLTPGTPSVYPALGVTFAAEQVLYFTGNFTIKILVWLTGA